MGKRNLLILISLLALVFDAYACKCKLFTIDQGFEKSELVFYGKYLGSTVLDKATGLDGEEMIYEGFLLKKVFKGPVSILEKNRSNISILSSRGKGCGYTFDTGNWYLVYADLDYRSMQLQVSQCSRTRSVRNDFFVVSNTGDPDDGRDEFKELLKLSKMDSSIFSLEAGKIFEAKMKLLMSEREDLKKEVKKRTSMTIVLSTSVLILVIYVLFDFLKKRKV